MTPYTFASTILRSFICGSILTTLAVQIASAMATESPVKVILTNSVDSDNESQVSVEGILKEDVLLVDGSLIPAKSKIIGSILHLKLSQRFSNLAFNFKTIIFPDGKKLDVVAIPKIRGGILQLKRNSKTFDLYGTSFYWHERTRSRGGLEVNELIVPYGQVCPVKHRGAVHLEVGDELLLEFF